MAESESSGSTGIVAIFAIMLMLVIAGFIAWQMGAFGGRDHKRVDVNIHAPTSSQ